MDEKRKNTIILTVVGIATLVVAVIGLSFAYFQAHSDDMVTRNVRITTETADSTSYTIDKALSLRITQQNFGEAAGDLKGDDTTAIALFTASTGQGNDLCYTLKANVTTNEFFYTSNLNATPTDHYVATVGSDTTTYYDDLDTNNTTETALLTYLTTNSYVREDSNVTYIKETPTSSNEVTLTAFYGSATSKLSVFVAAGYLEEIGVYPTSTDPELVLNVTRQSVSNADNPFDLTYGAVENIITNLDITSFRGELYIPDSLTNVTVVTSSNANGLDSFDYYDAVGGPKNIHKLTSAAAKTTAHKYTVWVTAKNKAYDQEEITNKHFSGTLVFNTVSCDTPSNP